MNFIILIFITFASFASADQVDSYISYIDEKPGEETLFLLQNGQVLRGKNLHKIDQGNRYSFIHRDGVILSAKKLDETKTETLENPDQEFEPTLIESMERARGLFTDMKSIQVESQCFNRATVWTHQWFYENKINSFKSWIFFTRKYIREYQFKWWFHVAPSLDVLENGIIKEKIMDKKYASGPLDPRAWTNIFMKNKVPCRRINNYLDYAHYPESTSCFILRSNMFYHQPVDIELFNSFGISKNSFDQNEIATALSDTET